MHLSFALACATTLASLSSAHTIFTTLFIDDVNQGDGTCVRMSKNSDTCTNPIAGLDSQDMACGVDGLNAVAFTCPASAGSKLTFEYREWADLEQPGAIDISHKGPCAVYLKAMSNMATDSAAGSGWFKIWDEGYDSTTSKWCTEKLIDNKGLLSVNLPTGIPTGSYLVRPELLALHEADKGDPQFYVGCAQLFVTGTTQGTLQVPSQYQASIPGYVSSSDPGVTFNIYDTPLALPYKIPGPAIYFPTAASSSGKKARAAASAAAGQTVGAVPANCLIVNANWCGVEVPSYTTEDGCWAASENCFRQQDACYKSAPPTGSKGCDRWGDKCTGIQNACSAGKFTGPPNMGQKLGNVYAAVPGTIPPAAPMPSGAAAAVASGAASATSAVAAAGATSVVASGVAGSTASVSSAAPTARPTGSGSDGDDDGDSDDTDGSDDDSDDGTVVSPGTGLTVSEDGACGSAGSNQTCQGSASGDCCSAMGQCGSSKLHCGCGCQPGFGLCQ